MVGRFLFDLLSENPKRAIKITIFANLVFTLVYLLVTFVYQQYKFNQVSELLAADGYEYVGGVHVNYSLLPLNLLFKDSRRENPTTFLYISDITKPIDEFSFYFNLGVDCKTKVFSTDKNYRISTLGYFRKAGQYDGQTAIDILGHMWAQFIYVTADTLCPAQLYKLD